MQFRLEPPSDDPIDSALEAELKIGAQVTFNENDDPQHPVNGVIERRQVLYEVAANGSVYYTVSAEAFHIRPRELCDTTQKDTPTELIPPSDNVIPAPREQDQTHQVVSGSYIYAPFNNGHFFGKVLGPSTLKRKWNVGFFDEDKNDEQSVLTMKAKQILKWQQTPALEVQAKWDNWQHSPHADEA